jgi:hypothetical protein
VEDFETILEMYEDYTPGPRNMAQGGRIPFNNGGDAVRLKKLQEDYDNFGKKELNKAAKTLGFKDYASMSGQENNNFRRKIKKELTEFGSALPEKESRSRSRVEKRIPKEQGIQIKLLEETNKKKFFDPKKFAKENKISMKQLKDEARKLRNNIYDKRMLVSGKEMRSTLEWIPDDLKQADNTLNKLWKSKLIANDRGKIENLFYDAFGNPDSPTFNPKKHLAIRNNLTEYYQLRDAIKTKYPNINLALDHPLSKSSLKNLFNASADQLTRVNPLEFDLNNGFKDSLSQQYELSVKNKNPNQKKAVEKIAKDLKINIGKINKDATNFNYGVKEFQKLNMKDEVLKAVQNQADLSSNFKNYVKQNPDLFKAAGVNPNTNITKITQTQVKGIAKKLDAAGFKCQLSNGLTCNDPRAYTKSIKENMAKVQQGDDAAISKVNKLGKGMNAFKGAAKFTGWGLLTELGIAAPLAAVDYAKGANKDEIISNVTYGLFGKSEDEQLREKYPDYGQAKDFQKTYDKLLEQENALGDQTGYGPIINPQNVENTEKKLMEQSKQFDSVLPPSQGLRSEFDLGKFLNMMVTDQQRDKFFADQKAQRSKEIGILKPSTGLESYDNFMEGGIASLNVKK